MTVTRRATSLGERQVIVEDAPRGITQNTICMHEIKVRKTYAFGEILHFFRWTRLFPMIRFLYGGRMKFITVRCRGT